MKGKGQLYILVALLVIVGFGLSAYKYVVLGFNLTPSKAETVWQVQARIQFDATGGPAKVVFTLPDNEQQRSLIFKDNSSKDYTESIVANNGLRNAVWTRDDARGRQTIYLRGDFYRQQDLVVATPKIDEQPPFDFDENVRVAADALLLEARKTATSDVDLALILLKQIGSQSQDPNVVVLLDGIRYRHERLGQVSQVLALAGVYSQVVRGIRLEGKYTQRSITSFLRVYSQENGWQLLDANAFEAIAGADVLLWPHNIDGILDVYGGTNSRVDISVSSEQRSADRLAVAAANIDDSFIVDFSIYSLPIKDQNTFKLLLLIPIGALVVVVLRNLVGISTSGTFMPILIAMTFMKTSLLLGLLMFLIVVGVGLIMRSYLSHLNLLLVPRIGAVLVFVIVIFAAIGISSHKFGWEAGLTITLFPMIIMSWTIERMSVLWEEEGPREVVIQGGGSLLTASLAYMVMSNKLIAHLTFNFPSLLLVLLAVIIMIGSYNGYRLLELWRFEPITRDE